MAMRGHLRPSFYLTTTVDEKTARALEEGASERKVSLAGYAREVLTEHFATRGDANVKRLRGRTDGGE